MNFQKHDQRRNCKLKKKINSTIAEIRNGNKKPVKMEGTSRETKNVGA